MRILEGFSATVFCSETLGRPQKCYSWIWHFLAFDDSWPSTKVGGLRRRRGKRNFAAELLGLPSSTNEGNLCEKRKGELGDIGSFTSMYYYSKVFLFNKCSFDSTNWIKKARGTNCVKRNSFWVLQLPLGQFSFGFPIQSSLVVLAYFSAAAELTFHLWFWIKLP